MGKQPIRTVLLAWMVHLWKGKLIYYGGLFLGLMITAFIGKILSRGCIKLHSCMQQLPNRLNWHFVGRKIGCDEDLSRANRTTWNEAPLARRHLDGCRRELSFQRSVCACWGPMRRVGPRVITGEIPARPPIWLWPWPTITDQLMRWLTRAPSQRPLSCLFQIKLIQ